MKIIAHYELNLYPKFLFEELRIIPTLISYDDNSDDDFIKILNSPNSSQRNRTEYLIKIHYTLPELMISDAPTYYLYFIDGDNIKRKFDKFLELAAFW